MLFVCILVYLCLFMFVYVVGFLYIYLLLANKCSKNVKNVINYDRYVNMLGI